MKIIKHFFAVCILVASHAALALPIVNLELSDNSIQVGEQFELEVWIVNDVVGEEFLSFGFDISAVSPLLSYSGYTLPIEYLDASFGALNVSGLAFPGITDANIQLASLMFRAEGAGVANIAIEGLFDNVFYGLFFENSGFDMAAQLSFNIAPAPVFASSPNMWVFSLIAFSAYILRRKAHAKCTLANEGTNP